MMSGRVVTIILLELIWVFASHKRNFYLGLGGIGVKRLYQLREREKVKQVG